MKERGFAMLGFLVIAALMGLLLASLYFHIGEIVFRSSASVHSALAEESSTSDAIEASLNSISAPQQFLTACQIKANKRGQIEISRTLCSRQDKFQKLLPKTLDGSSLKNKSLFPQFDYSKLFQAPKNCNFATLTSFTKSSLGFSLTPTSQLSNRTCSGPLLPVQGASYLANLEFAEALQISSPQLLAAAGYVDFGGELDLQADLTIVAAGDIHIRELSASSQSLSLLSATGAIVIDSVIGTANVKLAAWQGVFAPNLPPSSVNSLELWRLPQQIQGFILLGGN